MIRVVDLAQGGTRMTGLAARPASRRAPQGPRAGLASPSVDGGLDEFREFDPTWRSNFAILALNSAISAAWAATSAANSS